MDPSIDKYEKLFMDEFLKDENHYNNDNNNDEI